MDNAFTAQVDRCGRLVRVDAQPGGFSGDQFHAVVPEVFVKRPGGIAASPDAGDEVVRVVASLLRKQLLFDFTADNRLQPGHHIGVGMRADRRADDVVGVRRVAAPVADSLVRRVLERFVAAGDRSYLRTEHLHFLYVEVLPPDVGLAHVDDALHVHQCADRRGRHAVLAGARLGDDPRFAHPPCEQDLSQCVVDLMRAGMVQVLALEVDFRTVFFRKPPCIV